MCASVKQDPLGTVLLEYVKVIRALFGLTFYGTLMK